MIRIVSGLFVLVLLLSGTIQAQQNKMLAAQVKAEFLHAWNGYKRYAWGHDDLKPLSKTYHDWYPEPLLMTAVDALDTMILMELDDEVATTKKYILDNLSFDKDIEVQNFEITIRLLGGLLTNYQLTGDKRFLDLAEDLGNRLLPVFNSPTGMPYRYVNLKTGKVSKPISNPAETGTLIIEFGTLSKLTGKPIFTRKRSARWLRLITAVRRLAWWASGSMSKPASGPILTVTSAARSTVITNTF
jgi:mannosidase alpha-like ER degradation enhancer 2